MPLGTFDRTPPPFFRQGPSALTKLAFFSALALFLMAADTRFAAVKALRAGLATALAPVERALLVPVDLWRGAGVYLAGLQHAIVSEDAARAALALQAERATRADALQQENTRLRGLLELRERLQVRSLAAETLYEASDAYSRKVIINRGSAQGVVAGSPVINEVGVLGQVTRVYPLSSEVTLLTDKDAAIPVLNTRTQQRSIAYGLAGGAGMELRFVSANADVQVGDALTTSGVDAVYPPGVPVATVASVERKSDAGFARIGIRLVAAPDGVRHVLVLEPLGVQLPPRPEPAPAAAPAAPARKAREAKHAGGKEAP
ncbi:MAG TPA: rod shape-determining protein MreC [Ideonella sp.]|nr:rod shape-determining protein MreC [Ideonella sp.]